MSSSDIASARRQGGSPGTAPRGAIGSSADAARLRRGLQIGLGLVWLLDAALQFQPYMFTRNFATATLAPSATGNPRWVAGPVDWTAQLVAGHPVLFNSLFAVTQLLLALGLFWPRTVRPALAASVAWSLGVWWLGEGLGGLLTGTGDPLTGAPGAALLYALLAVLVWPYRRGATGWVSVATTGPLGPRAARGLWLALWAGSACLTVQPMLRVAGHPHDAIAGLATGEPAWLARLDNNVAGQLAGTGVAFAFVSALVLGLIAVAIFAPARPARAGLALAVLVAVAYWVFGENFGGILTGQGTDPDTGPLLALLALAYWPVSPGRRDAPGQKSSLGSA